jgi:hypothetical protein
MFSPRNWTYLKKYNHPQNKRETQNKQQNRKDIEDHSNPPMQMWLGPYIFGVFALAPALLCGGL